MLSARIHILTSDLLEPLPFDFFSSIYFCPRSIFWFFLSYLFKYYKFLVGNLFLYTDLAAEVCHHVVPGSNGQCFTIWMFRSTLLSLYWLFWFVIFGLPVLIKCKQWVPCFCKPIQDGVVLKQLSSSTIHCLLSFILSIRQ